MGVLARELPVKFSRVLTLLGIVSAGIIALAILVVAALAARPAVEAVTWHARHGNKVEFDGHTFRVPSMWIAAFEPYQNSMEIERAYGGGLIEFTSTGQTMDAAQAREWQIKSIAASNKYRTDPLREESGQIFKAEASDYVCINTVGPMPRIGEFWDCRITNTDLSVSIIAGTKYHHETWSILNVSQ